MSLGLVALGVAIAVVVKQTQGEQDPDGDTDRLGTCNDCDVGKNTATRKGLPCVLPCRACTEAALRRRIDEEKCELGGKGDVQKCELGGKGDIPDETNRTRLSDFNVVEKARTSVD